MGKLGTDEENEKINKKPILHQLSMSILPNPKKSAYLVAFLVIIRMVMKHSSLLDECGIINIVRTIKAIPLHKNFHIKIKYTLYYLKAEKNVVLAHLVFVIDREGKYAPHCLQCKIGCCNS